MYLLSLEVLHHRFRKSLYFQNSLTENEILGTCLTFLNEWFLLKNIEKVDVTFGEWIGEINFKIEGKIIALYYEYYEIKTQESIPLESFLSFDNEKIRKLAKKRINREV